MDDPAFRPDPIAEAKGGEIYNTRCVVCHGGGVAAARVAPDLRTSTAIVMPELFDQILHEGVLMPRGVPQFAELREQDRAELRQFLRAAARRAT